MNINGDLGIGKLQIAEVHPLESWMKDIHENGKFPNRVLKGELQTLSPTDRAFLIAYVTKLNFLHNAVHHNQIPLLIALLDAGADVNALDNHGDSLLTEADDAKVIHLLIERKALFISSDPKRSLLSRVLFLINRMHSQDSEEYKYFIGILPKLFIEASPQDLKNLIKNNVNQIIGLATKNPKLIESILNVIKKLQEEHLQIAAEIGGILLGEPSNSEIFDLFFSAIQKEIICQPVIEEILKNSWLLFYHLLSKEPIVNSLLKVWKPSENLLRFQPKNDNFRLALFCHGLFHAQSLNDAVMIFSEIKLFEEQLSAIPPTVRQACVEKVIQLQYLEKRTIWEAMSQSHCYFSKNILLLIEQFGIDPNWTSRPLNRNYLFTNLAKEISPEWFEKKMSKVNLWHQDRFKNNALEHHCYHHYEGPYEVIAKLSAAGLRLGDHFPNVEKLCKILPAHPHLQAYLGMCLLFPRSYIVKGVLKSISDKEQKLFVHCIKQDEECFKKLGKYLEKDSQKDLEMVSWESKFDEADRKKMQRALKDQYLEKDILDKLTSLWDDKIPSEELKRIPESFMASFALACIRKQYETKRKPLSVRFFFGLLSHDDMVIFSQYLFANPNYTKMCIHLFMKAKRLDLFPKGGEKTKFEELVFYLITKVGGLHHVPKFLLDCSKDQQQLIEAFNKSPTPKFMEKLPIEKGVAVKSFRSTLVVNGEGGTEYFKLATSKKWRKLQQEYGVTRVFHEKAAHFKLDSHVPKPIGLYLVQQLPSELKSLAKFPKGKEEPTLVYHYKTIPQSFRSMDDLQGKEWVEAAQRCLLDAGRLIRLGFYPKLFKRSDQEKNFLFLSDLRGKIINQEYYGAFHVYSNGVKKALMDSQLEHREDSRMRQSGLVHLWQASNIWDESNYDKHYQKFYLQMAHLSNALITYVMHLANPHLKAKKLEWENKELMKNFGQYVAAGFAMITAGYSGKTFGECNRFVQECGIDWTRAATQFAFWYDEGPSGYLKWIDAQKVPPGLYEENVQVTIDKEKALKMLQYHSEGAFGLIELDRAMYLFFFSIMLAEPLTPPPRPRPSYPAVGRI